MSDVEGPRPAVEPASWVLALMLALVVLMLATLAYVGLWFIQIKWAIAYELWLRVRR